MHELFYCSYAKRPMTDEDIINILEISRKNNEKDGVTGILLFYHKTRQFMQILEGEKDTIFKLLDKIKMDERHQSLKLIYDNGIDSRSFSKWSMAFTNFESINKSQLEGYSRFLEEGFTNELLKEEPSDAIKLFNVFKKVLP